MNPGNDSVPSGASRPRAIRTLNPDDFFSSDHARYDRRSRVLLSAGTWSMVGAYDLEVQYRQRGWPALFYSTNDEYSGLKGPDLKMLEAALDRGALPHSYSILNYIRPGHHFIGRIRPTEIVRGMAALVANDPGIKMRCWTSELLRVGFRSELELSPVQRELIISSWMLRTDHEVCYGKYFIRIPDAELDHFYRLAGSLFHPDLLDFVRIVLGQYCDIRDRGTRIYSRFGYPTSRDWFKRVTQICTQELNDRPIPPRGAMETTYHLGSRRF